MSSIENSTQNRNWMSTLLMNQTLLWNFIPSILTRNIMSTTSCFHLGAAGDQSWLHSLLWCNLSPKSMYRWVSRPHSCGEQHISIHSRKETSGGKKRRNHPSWMNQRAQLLWYTRLPKAYVQEMAWFKMLFCCWGMIMSFLCVLLYTMSGKSHLADSLFR